MTIRKWIALLLITLLAQFVLLVISGLVPIVAPCLLIPILFGGLVEVVALIGLIAELLS